MDQNRRHSGTSPLVATLAVTLGATAPAAAITGCADTKLPPTPVPTMAFRTPLPDWFDPNLVWDPQRPADTRVYINGKIIFDTAKATIKKPSEKVLWELHAFLLRNPWVTRLRVEGHTDSRADDDYNQALSARRSLAVCHWLVEHDIDPVRLVAVGFGESKPIGPNYTAAGRQENRRTEFHVMEVDGRPFGPKNALDGGMTLDVLTKQELYDLKHPKKVIHPKPPPFVPRGNEFNRYKPPPKKPIDADTVIQAPGVDAPADAGPIKKDDKDKPKGGGGGGAAPPAGGGAAPP